MFKNLHFNYISFTTSITHAVLLSVFSFYIKLETGQTYPTGTSMYSYCLNFNTQEGLILPGLVISKTSERHNKFCWVSWWQRCFKRFWQEFTKRPLMDGEEQKKIM